MAKTVKETTLKFDLCINCGICKTACKFGAIELKPDKNGEYRPVIDKRLCKKCGACAEFCPNTKEKFQVESKKICQAENPHVFGLLNANYYLAANKNQTLRQKCCSGGVATGLGKYLLENKKIDSMIHVERLFGNKGDLHYGVRISSSIEDIENNVSSAYQPVDFSNIKIAPDKTYFLTGTPCIIRGMKRLFKNVITCALICSHNVNSKFVDYFFDTHNLSDKEKWQVNLRNKDNIIDANNFNNHFYTKNGDLLKMNRHKSGWTDIWRAYYMAMGACLYCPDFWGYEADISIKDAWGEWSIDPLGKSIVIVRNKELEELFLKADFEIEPLPFEKLENHQKTETEFKQNQSVNKNFKPFFSKSNRKNKLFKRKIISYSSKFLYRNFGAKITKFLMKYVEKLAEFGGTL